MKKIFVVVFICMLLCVCDCLHVSLIRAANLLYRRVNMLYRRANMQYRRDNKRTSVIFFNNSWQALEAERQLQAEENGRNRTGSSGYLVDAFGVRRDEHGPFWPADHDGPLFAGPAVRTTRRAGQEEVASPAEPLLTTASPGLRPSAGK